MLDRNIFREREAKAAEREAKVAEREAKEASKAAEKKRLRKDARRGEQEATEREVSVYAKCIGRKDRFAGSIHGSYAAVIV